MTTQAAVKKVIPADAKIVKVKKMTAIAGKKTAVTIETPLSKKENVTQKATVKKVVAKKSSAKAKKPVAAPVIVDAIGQENVSQPQTIIHPDAPWPFKKPE